MIRSDLLAHDDYTLVRAALVRVVGSASAAMVLQRIAWRCAGPQARDGWWTGSLDLIAAETGLSAAQVQRAVAKLRQGGWLIGEQRSGGYDRTLSYRPNTGEVSDPSKLQNRNIEVAKSQDVLVLETEETEVVEGTDVPQSSTASSAPDRLVTKREATYQGNHLAYVHTWSPPPVVAVAVIESARLHDFILTPDEHLDHYISRCSELKRSPSGTEWLRWFNTDQAKRVAEERQSIRGDGIEVDESGTPKSWRKK